MEARLASSRFAIRCTPTDHRRYRNLWIHLIEEWPLLDSLYTSVISITTVGYGEVGQRSGTGRFFTICLIISSAGIAAYLVPG
jgi:hypothetical protein